MPVNKEGTRIIDRREMLRIKLKSLVAEVRIIQREEKRMPTLLRMEMQAHRKTVIRNVSRHTHLALGFLRGRSYEQLERIHHSEPEWKKVEDMLFRYGAMNYTSTAQQAIALLVKHWREHPSWKPPQLNDIYSDYAKGIRKGTLLGGKAAYASLVEVVEAKLAA